MSDASKDLIGETKVGRNAHEAKDLLMLLRRPIQTHMSGSSLGAEQSLHKTQSHQGISSVVRLSCNFCLSFEVL